MTKKEHVQTKAIITIPDTKTPAFIASQTLKDIVNGI
jgi:nucleoid DNA-binding protein